MSVNLKGIILFYTIEIFCRMKLSLLLQVMAGAGQEQNDELPFTST